MLKKLIRTAASIGTMAALYLVAWTVMTFLPETSLEPLLNPIILASSSAEELQFLNLHIWENILNAMSLSAATSCGIAITWMAASVFGGPGFKPRDPKEGLKIKRYWYWFFAVAAIASGTVFFLMAFKYHNLDRHFLVNVQLAMSIAAGFAASLMIFWLGGTLFFTPPVAKHGVPFARFIR